MKRTSLLVALLVVIGMLVVPATVVLAQDSAAETEADDTDVSPGEQLSGVVGVQSAAFDGEIERNAFTIALDRADDNATKAGHIAAKLTQTEERLAELNERKATLETQRESGEITEGQYRARMAKIATEVETVNQQLNQSNATAAELPAETLEANGVNTTKIQTLMHNASELSGPEVSEIARSIAGDRSGLVDRGPPGDHGASGEQHGDRGSSEDRSGDRGPSNNDAEQRDDSSTADSDEGEQADTDDDERNDADSEEETQSENDETNDEDGTNTAD